MSSREPLYNTKQRSCRLMKAVLCADNFGMSVVDGRKLEVSVAREDLQAGIPEVLDHEEPLRLGGGVECSGPKCWFTPHFLYAPCELGYIPGSSVTVYHPPNGAINVIYAMR